MRSKKHILLKMYSSIKEQFGDLVSISDLANHCEIHQRSIQRYLSDGTIYYFEITPKKRAIIIDSILPDFKLPSQDTLHKYIQDKNIYCNEKDLNLSDLKLMKKFNPKKITFQNTTLFCMLSLNKILFELEEKERIVLWILISL